MRHGACTAIVSTHTVKSLNIPLENIKPSNSGFNGVNNTLKTMGTVTMSMTAKKKKLNVIFMVVENENPMILLPTELLKKLNILPKTFPQKTNSAKKLNDYLPKKMSYFVQKKSQS